MEQGGAAQSMERTLLQLQIRQLLLTGTVISFLGWAWESVYSLLVGTFSDRGFLIGPICPIYGISVILVYLLLDTPQRMRMGRRPLFSLRGRYVLYFCLTAGLAMLIEFVTGWFFERVFHIRLWDYGSFGMQWLGHIALLPGLFWGALITCFMRFGFDPIQQRVESLPRSALVIVSNVVCVLVAADFIFNVGYLLVMGTHFTLF